MIKIFITSSSRPETQREYGFPEAFKEQYHRGAHTPYALVDSPEAADIIVYWVFYETSELVLNPRLKAEENIRRYPEKCFVVNHEDRPLPFFPGVYQSLPDRYYDQDRHRTGSYGVVMNRFISSYAEKGLRNPEYLATFIGTLSDPVRSVLVNDAALQASCLLRTIPNFAFTHDREDPDKAPGQELYAAQIANGKFSLCPRGGGATSHRIYESMQLSRCPVIISDAWVAPVGAAWPDCSIRVAERHVKHLPEILEEHEPHWEQLGQAARREWEKWFDPEIFVYRMLQSIVDIYRMKTTDERVYRRTWKWLALEHYYDQSRVARGVRKVQRIRAAFSAKRTL